MIHRQEVINEKRILIEGWREINHSYALVNQYQLIWLSKLTSQLYHHDVPYINKAWSKEVNSSGFNPKMNSIVANIPSYNGQPRPPDITYRIASPLKSCEFKSELKYVFGTSEYQNLEGTVSDEDIQILAKSGNETIVTPSSWSAIGFSKAGISEERIKVIPHGIEPSVFYPEDNSLVNQCRKNLGIGENDFVILSLGAMTKNKGIDTLLLAFAVLKEKYNHIRLILKDQSNLYGSAPTNELKSFITKTLKCFRSL
jgi:glycosyltransferase involved in cell wall biosynthesis